MQYNTGVNLNASNLPSLTEKVAIEAIKKHSVMFILRARSSNGGFHQGTVTSCLISSNANGNSEIGMKHLLNQLIAHARYRQSTV